MPEFDATISYRDIPGHDGYKVGSDGSVWSCLTGYYQRGRGRKGVRFVPGPHWVQLRPGTLDDGRQVVCLRGKTHRIHRLVMLAFVGPCPPGLECCHFPDRNPANNDLSNLRYDTRSNNHLDKWVHGTMPHGETASGAKLSDAAVQSIRDEYAAGGISQSRLAAKHGVCQTQIGRIVRRTRRGRS